MIDYTAEYMYPPPPEQETVQCKDCVYWYRWERWNKDTCKIVTYPYGWCKHIEEHTAEEDECECGVPRDVV